MRPTETQNGTTTKLKRIAWLSAKEPDKTYAQLVHHINLELLLQCFYELDGKKAIGVDGVTKEQYSENLIENLHHLVARMKRMAYIPGPVREVRIPKEGKPGATRPLGISNFEDKIVQKAVQKVLESVYDPVFKDCSFGFRPRRGCHDAIRALHKCLFSNHIQTIIDVDLANFFGTIDHTELMKVLRKKIKDQRFLRYMTRLLKAGVLSDGEMTVSDEGVPQGSVCSPVLANIFAHHVIDQWFDDVVKSHCRGKVDMFRYADDMVIACQYQSDAVRIRKALALRLLKYKLALNEDKTYMVSFSKRKARRGMKQGTFDFLGFTFYLGRSRPGDKIPMLKSSGKRLRSKLKNVSAWVRSERNKYPLVILWKRFCAKLRGHIQYYGVSFNARAVQGFLNRAKRIFYKWINRRSQRKSFNWDKFQLFLERYPMPKVRIYHQLF